jgi:putative peptidoglycan lipid II flippase
MPPPLGKPGASQFIGPILSVSLFTFVRMVLEFVTQVVVATTIGAGVEMDAYLAAYALPQYVSTILAGALGVVFIPVFVERVARGEEAEAAEMAGAVCVFSFVALSGVALVGVVGAQQLLRWSAPGLVPETLELAATVARVTWLTVIASGLISLVSAIHHVRRSFSWPAAVPVVGGLVALGALYVLVPALGVIGLALAVLLGLTVQVSILGWLVLRGPVARLRPRLRAAGLWQFWHLLWPLLISGVFIRGTVVVDLYAASSLPEGTISYLAYALRLVALVGTQLSAGAVTVIFPTMAAAAGVQDLPALRQTVSLGLRMMWLVVAPVIALYLVLALPLATALFQRGAFTAADAQAVSDLLRWYSLALVAITLGNITGRALYALKATRLVSMMGVLEMLAYAVYTPWLAGQFGGVGVALGYVIYFSVSLTWQLVVLWHKLGRARSASLGLSFARTAAAASLVGAAVWAVLLLVPGAWGQVLVAVLVALVLYPAGLHLLRSTEVRVLWRALLGLRTAARHSILGR